MFAGAAGTNHGTTSVRAPARSPKEEGRHMEHIGAGLAALGVIGPGIGIGILTGMAAQAIGRNPDAASTIRAQFILGAAFAEGLGVLAIVVAILAIVLK
jgi:F-type H+-transporting ATPase subunit c